MFASRLTPTHCLKRSDPTSISIIALAKSARRRHHLRRSRDIYAEIKTLCCSAAWRGSSMPQSFHGAVTVCDPPTLLSFPFLNSISYNLVLGHGLRDTIRPSTTLVDLHPILASRRLAGYFGPGTA